MTAASHEDALPERTASDLDRRRHVLLVLAVGYLPATVVMQATAHAGVVPAVVPWVGIPLWFLAFVVALFRVHDFRCPRCSRRYAPRVEWHRPVCCASCGLLTGPPAGSTADPMHTGSSPRGRPR